MTIETPIGVDKNVEANRSNGFLIIDTTSPGAVRYYPNKVAGIALMQRRLGRLQLIPGEPSQTFIQNFRSMIHGALLHLESQVGFYDAMIAAGGTDEAMEIGELEKSFCNGGIAVYQVVLTALEQTAAAAIMEGEIAILPTIDRLEIEQEFIDGLAAEYAEGCGMTPEDLEHLAAFKGAFCPLASRPLDHSLLSDKFMGA